MKIFHFGPEVGRTIDKFGSVDVVLSGIARLAGDARVSCMHFSPGGLVGYHQAVTPQLFLVTQGEGWVRGVSSGRMLISAGRAAFWEKDEWHESGTDVGMTAIVIESETLNPAEFMPGL